MENLLRYTIEVVATSAEGAVSQVEAQFQKLGKAAHEAGEMSVAGMAIAGGALVTAATATAGAMIMATSSVAHLGDELHDMSQRAGISSQSLQVLGFAAEQSGASMQDVVVATRFLSRNLVEAAGNMTSNAAQAFDKLGVSAVDADGKLRKADDVILDLAEAFEKMEDGAHKTALAVALFGRGGTALLPMLNEGRAGLERFKQTLTATGSVLSNDMVKASDKFEDEMKVMEKSLSGLSVVVATTLIPQLTELVEKTTGVVQSFNQWAQANPDLVKDIEILVGVMAGTGGLLVAASAIVAILPFLTAGFVALTGPLGLAVAAVVGLTAAFISLSNQSSKLQQDLQLSTAGFNQQGQSLLTHEQKIKAVTDGIKDHGKVLADWNTLLEASDEQMKKSGGTATQFGKVIKETGDDLSGVVIRMNSVKPTGFTEEQLQQIEDAAMGMVKQVDELGRQSAVASKALDLLSQKHFSTAQTAMALGDSLQKVVDQNRALGIATDPAIVKMAALGEQIKRTVASIAAIREGLTAARQAMAGTDDQTAILLKSIQTMTDVPFSLWWDTNGEALKKYVDKLRAWGEVVPGNIQSLLDQGKALEQTRAALELDTKQTEEDVDANNRASAALENLIATEKMYGDTMEQVQKQLDFDKRIRDWGLLIQQIEKYDQTIQRSGVFNANSSTPLMSPVPGTGINSPVLQQQVNVPPPSPDQLEQWKKWEADGQKAIDTLVNDISKMFIDSVAHGKSFWEAFKGLGTDAITSLTNFFLTDFLHKALDPFKKQIGQALDTMKDKLSGLFGGGALGGGIASGIIAGGIAGISALASAFGQGRKEADKFVQSIQNPFQDAAGKLFDSLVKAQQQGKLTVDQVNQASDSLEEMWQSFQDAASKASHGVGQQAINGVAPIMQDWRNWINDLRNSATETEAAQAAAEEATRAATEAIKQFNLAQERVTNVMGRVSQPFGIDPDAYEQAVVALMNSGVSIYNIIRILGPDIENMVDTLNALGLAVPATVGSIAVWIKDLQRIKDISAELKDVYSQLGSALKSYLATLDSQIQQTNSQIETWTSQLDTVNKSIVDNTALLNNAGYWQDKYNQMVQKSADTLEQVTRERMDLEKRIPELETQIQRDALQEALDSAKDRATTATTVMVETFASGMTKTGGQWLSRLTQTRTIAGTGQDAVAAAQKALDAFDRQQRLAEIEARKQQLVELKAQLASTIVAENDARANYYATSAAATKAVQDEADALAKKVIADRESALEIWANIYAAQEHVKALQAEREKTIAFMNALGIARDDELTAIGRTIIQLINRASALEDEGDALAKLFPLADKATTNIKAALAAIASFTGGGVVNIPAYAVGTRYVPETGFALLHKGEAVVPAIVNRNSGNQAGWSGGSAAGQPIIYFSPNINIGHWLGDQKGVATLVEGLARQTAKELNRLVNSGSVTLTASKVKK